MGALKDWTAFGSPLLHPLILGLGWAPPDVGVASWWRELGQPTNDVRLNVVSRWWGDSLVDFVAWTAADGSAFAGICATVARATGTVLPTSPAAPPLRMKASAD